MQQTKVRRSQREIGAGISSQISPGLDHQAGDGLTRVTHRIRLRRRARLPQHERHQRRRENDQHPGVAALPAKFGVTHRW